METVKKKLLDYKDPQRKHKLHTIVGFGIAAITYLLMGLSLQDYLHFRFSNYEFAHWSLGLIGLVTSLAAGVLKEIYDESKGFDFDKGDVLATWIGGGLFAILISIIN